MRNRFFHVSGRKLSAHRLLLTRVETGVKLACMTFSLGIVGAGQFAGAFAKLFDAHPAISEVHVTDVLPERAEALRERLGLAGTYPSFEAMLDGGLDAVAIFTQRWTHGPAGAAGAPRGQARLLGSADGHQRGRDRPDHRRRPGDGPDLHDGRDQLLQPRHRLCPQAQGRRRLRPHLLRRGRLRPRHGPRLLRGLPVQRRGGLEDAPPATRPCCTRPTPSAGCWARSAAMPSASAASASPTSAATACSTRTSACSATTSPMPPRCSSFSTAGPCASTRCAASATPPTCAKAASGSSAPKPASSSWPRSVCGRTRSP